MVHKNILASVVNFLTISLVICWLSLMYGVVKKLTATVYCTLGTDVENTSRYIGVDVMLLVLV